jgi:plastocyanin
LSLVNKRWRLGLLLAVLAVCIIAVAIFSPRLFASRDVTPPAQKVKVAAPAVVTIPRGQDLFEPFILPVQPGTAVVWQNNDTTAHVLSTTPDSSAFLNRRTFSMTVDAGKSVKLTFTKAGIYHYYETLLDSWSGQFSRVVAARKSVKYPLSMEGVIWVQGPIADLPSTALSFMLKDHDDFATEFLAISDGGAVTWHNLNEYPHFVGLVAGWSSPVNPADIGLYRLAGTEEVTGGGSTTVLFNTPGLYYYYCRNHDKVDPATKRAFPLPMASEYPIPMEGFVLVI